MNVNSGRYSLVKKSTIDNECEYFDFSPNILDFVDEPSLDGTTKVSLATIDALTAAFDNPRELCEYFSKSRIPREEFASLISIDYKSQKGEDKSICTIWQDDTLQKIAAAAKGGKVDLNDQTTNEVLHDMYYRLKNTDNGFAQLLFTTDSNDMKINNHNVKLINVAINRPLDGTVYQKFAESFSNYREFRALYVAYKRNVAQLEKQPGKRF